MVLVGDADGFIFEGFDVDGIVLGSHCCFLFGNKLLRSRKG